MSSGSEFELHSGKPSSGPASVDSRPQLGVPGPPGEPEAAPGYGYYGSTQDEGFGVWNIRRYLRVVSRRRWSAMTAFLVVFTSVVVYNFTAVPVYRATARVVVEFDQYNRAVVEDVYSQWRSLDAELAILESRWLAQRTVESLGLAKQEEPDAEPNETASDPTGTWATAWSAVRAFSSKAFGIGTPESEVVALADASTQAGEPGFVDGPFGESLAEARHINAFLGGLSVSFTTASSAVLDITYQSDDPDLSARFANTHANQYITQTLERRVEAIAGVTDWLGVRLAEQREKVDASELALAQFREQNALTTVEGASPTLTRLNGLSGSLTQTQSKRLEQEAIYNQALALRGDPERLDQLPVMASDPTLLRRRLDLEQVQQKRADLGASLRDRHPDMVALQDEIQTLQAGLEAERNRLLESLRQEIVATQASEDGLTAALENLNAEAVTQDQKSVQFSVLMREAESARQLYDLVLERAQVTGDAQEISSVRTRVLDQALVPAGPVSPNRQQNLLRGIAGGFLLAMVVAFGLERLDNHVRSPDDVRGVLELPFLGLLPEVRNADQSTPLVAANGLLPQFSEELRHIRTNLLFSFSGDAARSVVVSSTSPNEGKSVVASNLAVALAQTGERVLLVDADMRRPTVHKNFAIDQQPGLSNVLVGNCKPSEAIRSSDVAGLSILPAGRCPPNPSELLGSPEFKRLLNAIGERFSWIILDTPPVLAVTDACVLAHVVSGVVFVVGADRVSRPLARRAIEQIAAAHGTLVGAVLNHVEVERYSYYYSSYSANYGRKYNDYYRTAG